MSIGYEAKLTPLHTLMLYNAIANDGKMVKPMIVKAVARGNQIEEEYETEVVRRSIASSKTIDQLKILLEGVVQNGTAKNVYTEEYKIAGKTGTAQKLIGGRYTQRYYTSFAGYFPADNPKYSAIVVIDSPKGFAAYGGDVSAPVFKEIADKIFAQDLELNEKENEMKTLAIAMLCHSINAAYCQSLGDESQLAWEDTPDSHQQSLIAGVEMHLANPQATPEQSHESWYKQKEAEGWIYGEVKDLEKKEHPCFLPYDELPLEQKAKDYLFRATVHLMKDLPDVEEYLALADEVKQR